MLYVFIDYFRGLTNQGWASVMVSVWFLGSVILLSNVIISEYIGKIYTETKQRPKFFIETELWDKE